KSIQQRQCTFSPVGCQTKCPVPSAECRVGGCDSALGTRHSALLVTKDLLEPLDRPFNVLPLAVDLIRPFAELVVGDGRRLIEVLLVEEHAAQNAAEDSDRAVVRGRGAFQERLMPRAGTAVTPQHPAVGIDVAERDARWCG